MKTILHTIDTTGPGGAETVCIDLATKLPAGNYRPVVALRGPGWVQDEFRRRGVEPLIVPSKGSFNLRYLLGLVRLLRRERIDLVQSHLLGAGVYCSAAGFVTGVPVVATIHGEVDIGAGERFRAVKAGILNHAASRVVVVSRGLEEYVLTHAGFKASKLEIIYNGIDTAAFARRESQYARQRLGLAPTDFVVGCLGNIRMAKGYDILLEAASLLEDPKDRIRFVIAGQPDTGSLYPDLLEKRRALGLERRVHFLGFVDDAAAYLSSLDLFLSTSISEGLPLSAIQAMAAGLPVVATRCGGYLELLRDGVNGCLVAIGDARAIAAAVARVAESPEFAVAIGRAARNHVEETFDQSVMLRRYRELYDALTVASPSGR